jgi:hypothetical protein
MAGDLEAMENETLRRQLQELHDELQQVKSLDATERELLLNLAVDVQEALRRDDDQAEHLSSLSSRLKEALAQLEASHPRATMLMRSVIDQLSFMGI